MKCAYGKSSTVDTIHRPSKLLGIKSNFRLVVLVVLGSEGTRYTCPWSGNVSASQVNMENGKMKLYNTLLIGRFFSSRLVFAATWPKSMLSATREGRGPALVDFCPCESGPHA